jgi:signal transduction histidine kinase
VTDVLPTEGVAADDLLLLAASVEHGSEHPLGEAVVREAEARGLALLPVSGFEALPGQGVRATVEKVVGLVRPLAEKKGLALRTTYSSTIEEALGDQRRVEQILLNLLNNAVKFTEQGEVSIAIESVTPMPLTEGPDASAGPGDDMPMLRFVVRDTGIGIRPEHVPVLFQPFRQIDVGLTRRHEGTGLGLAICRRLATLMGGTISVASEWGKGSEFTVTLPVCVIPVEIGDFISAGENAGAQSGTAQP